MKMDTQPFSLTTLSKSVIAVPPLCRDEQLNIDTKENQRLVRYLEEGGIRTLLYGGNAVFYHIRLSEYAAALSMLAEIAGPSTCVVPSVGPAYGTMMDQATILRDFDFPTVMVLPQKEIADQLGIVRGIRDFAEAFGKPIVLYLKHDRWISAPLVQALVNDGMVSWIKYAVVRDNPSQDDYLRELLEVVDGKFMVSGIGEQPAIVHVNEFGMASFTSGCVCAAPKHSAKMLKAIQAGDLGEADRIRRLFEPLEDLRNSIQPIRVLHRAVALAEIAATGPMLPMLGELILSQSELIATAAKQLVESDRSL